MAKFTYETVDGMKDGFVPGIGAIVDGKIESDTPIESPNLKLAGTVNPPAPVVGTASQQNPNQPTTAGSSQPANPGVQE